MAEAETTTTDALSVHLLLTALVDHQPHNDDDYLTFKKGDLLAAEQLVDLGVWYGTHLGNGRRGFFDSREVELLQQVLSLNGYEEGKTENAPKRTTQQQQQQQPAEEEEEEEKAAAEYVASCIRDQDYDIEQLYLSSQAVSSRRNGSVRCRGTLLQALENSLAEYEAEFAKDMPIYRASSFSPRPTAAAVSKLDEGPTIEDYENYFRELIEAAQERGALLPESFKDRGLVNAGMRDSVLSWYRELGSDDDDDEEEVEEDQKKKKKNGDVETMPAPKKFATVTEKTFRKDLPRHHNRGISISDVEFLLAARKLQSHAASPPAAAATAPVRVDSNGSKNGSNSSVTPPADRIVFSPPPPSVTGSPTVLSNQSNSGSRSELLHRLYNREIDRLPPPRRPRSTVAASTAWRHSSGGVEDDDRNSIVMALEEELEKLLHRQSQLLVEDNEFPITRQSLAW